MKRYCKFFWSYTAAIDHALDVNNSHGPLMVMVVKNPAPYIAWMVVNVMEGKAPR